MRKLLRWVADRRPARLITGDNGRPYLARYHLFSGFGVTCYLHRFVASDPDRGLHSHPWPWACSVKLSGWYLEERLSPHPDESNLLRAAPRVHWLAGTSFHRVVLPLGATECWTLFIHSRERATWWGFLTRRGDKFDYTPYRYPENSPNIDGWWKLAPKGAYFREQGLID